MYFCEINKLLPSILDNHLSFPSSVHQVSEVESRSVLIQLSAPECNQQEFEIYPSEFRYELWLSEKGRDGKYKLVYRYKWCHLSGNPVSLAKKYSDE